MQESINIDVGRTLSKSHTISNKYNENKSNKKNIAFILKISIFSIIGFLQAVRCSLNQTNFKYM